jgi:nicotinate phosphoribosyltransferase
VSRLDSGDLEYLSRKVRERLDAAGLRSAKILASNELDEEIIERLVSRRVPIDAWGVGTNLVTGAGESALGGVYKMAARRDGSAADGWAPTIKVSNNPEKVTNPGIKQVWRFHGRDGGFIADLIGLDGEEVAPDRPHTFHHPSGDYRHFTVDDAAQTVPLLRPAMKAGERVGRAEGLAVMQARARTELAKLDDTYKRLMNPHVYRVSLSDRLAELKTRLVRETLSRGGES